MRFLVFVCLAVAAVSADHVEDDKRVCEPGSHYKEDCNDCICSNDGKFRACTMMLCPPTDPSYLRMSRQTREKICESGARKMDDCNHCICVNNGSAWACTAMACPRNVNDGSLEQPERVPNNSLLRQRRQVSHDRVCVPGDRFKIYCNTCTCGKDGFSVACTKMACPTAIWNEDGTLKNSEPVPNNALLRQRRQVSHDRVCVPGERFKIYCNTCTCGKDGFSVACTRMACPKEIWNEDGTLKNPEPVPNNALLRQRRQVSHDRVCVPGERFKIYCNTCTCGKDGFSVACTRMACPKEIWNEDGTLKNPEPVPNNALLRQRRQVSHDRVCVPGERFKIYCNTCTCGKDGFSVACTRMACPKEIWNEDGTLKNPEPVPNNALLRQRRQVSHDRVCVPGERFKIYCNTCTCGKDGFSVACTRMACPKEIWNEDGTLKNPEPVPNNALLRQRRQVSHDRVCVPGERFKIYCNTCTCGKDGFSVACTRMACPKEIWNEDGTLKNPEPVPNNALLRQRRQVSHDRVCVPGERFKIYCNTCTCGKDGFSVACTRMACPKEIWNEDGTLKNPEPVQNNALLRQRRQINNKACVPGERFNKYCNTCTCGIDGISSICTRKACPPEIYNEDGSFKKPEPVQNNSLLRQTRQVSHDRECVPGERFKIYCNTCTCGIDGFSVACTRMACPKEIWNEDGTLKHPEPVPNNALSI